MLLIRNKKIRLAAGLIETLNFLHLKLWLKNRGEARRFAGKIFRGYMSLVKHDRWRSQTIDELFPNMPDGHIIMEHMQGCGIFTPLAELAYLALITRNIRPKRIFEIGTFRGRTALNFALNSPPECLVYTLDLAPEDRTASQSVTNVADARIIECSDTGVDYRGKPSSEKIRQLFGDSTRFDFSPYYDQMDLVFIDGAHHYAAVESDTCNALKMAREGAWIVWHDFANYGDYNDVTRVALKVLPRDQIVQIDDTQLAVYRKRTQ